MSQIIKNNGGGGGPTVPTQFTTDFQSDQVTPNGTAIPAANNLNVLGGDGITTYVDPNNGDNLFIKVQNGFTDQTQTNGAVTSDLTTITLPTTGTYTIESRIAAWESTGPNGAGFAINGVVRLTAGVAVLIGDSDGFFHSDTALNGLDVNIIVSGATAIVRVSGVAGLTVNWGGFTVYVFRGA
jgi:hypothetical protein